MIKAVIFDFFGVVFVRADWDWKINEGLIDLIDNLRKEYKIGLISNSSQTSAKTILAKEGKADRLDQIIVSDEVGFSKPQPEIFEFAVKNLKVKPEEAVFIDDSAYNIDGAVAAGMKGIVYKDMENLKAELSKLGI